MVLGTGMLYYTYYTWYFTGKAVTSFSSKIQNLQGTVLSRDLPPSMSVKIYNSAAFADLVSDPDEGRGKKKKKKSSVRDSRSKLDSTTSSMFPPSAVGTSIDSLGSASPDEELSLMERALENHRQAIKNPQRGRNAKLNQSQSKLFEETEKKVQEARRNHEELVARSQQKRNAAFEENWMNLHEGEGFDLHNEWGARLDLLEKEKLNRKRQLARQWNEEVYEPIKARVQAHAEMLRESGIHRVRREEYDNFIEAVNLKGGLFLDEVDEAEYNPNVINRMAGTVNIAVEDPTIRTLQRHHEERLMNPADHHLKLRKTSNPGGLPHSKQKGVLSIKVWGKGKIEATPHGHFAAMHDRDGAPRKIPDMPATRVTLRPGYQDHFNPPKSLALMDLEWAARYGKGKACASRPPDNLKPGNALG